MRGPSYSQTGAKVPPNRVQGRLAGRAWGRCGLALEGISPLDPDMEPAAGGQEPNHAPRRASGDTHR